MFRITVLKSFFFLWIFSVHTQLMSVPIITELNPNRGPALGGTEVVITGSGFTGATAVTFGGKAALSFIVNSDQSITAISPSSSPLTVPIIVTTPSGVSEVTNESFYVYQGDYLVYVANNGSDTVSVIDTALDPLVAPFIPVGDGPNSIAITPDGTKAYVTNDSSRNVSVIDIATQTVVATVTVGLRPLASVALLPNGSKVYISNQDSDTVSVIDTVTNMLLHTISVGNGPVGVAVKPDGTRVYSLNFFSPSSVSVIETTNDTVVSTIVFGGTNALAGIVSQDGTSLYVANIFLNNVAVIDTVTNLSTIIPVGLFPRSLAITPDGKSVYVVNGDSSNLSVIDTATKTVVATIPVPQVGASLPTAIAMHPNGTKAYIGHVNGNFVTVIDTITNTVLTTVTVVNSPEILSVTPDGRKVYVANRNSGNVSVIDTATNTVIATIVTGLSSEALGMTPDQAPLAQFRTQIAPAGFPTLFDASRSASPVGIITNYSWDFGDGTVVNTSDPFISHTYLASGFYVVTLTVTNSAGTSTQQKLIPTFNSGANFSINQLVNNNGGPTATTQRQIFIPFLTPIVTNLNPNSGSACGGTRVTITGQNFIGVTDVFFGSTPALSFIVNSEASITAVAPPHSAGTVDVTVIAAFGTSAIDIADRFTYVLLPLPPEDLQGHQIKKHFATQTDRINVITWKAPSPSCGAPPFAYRIYRDRALTRLAGTVSAHCFGEKSVCLQFEDHNRQKKRFYTYFIVTVDREGNISAPSQIVIRQADHNRSSDRKRVVTESEISKSR